MGTNGRAPPYEFDTTCGFVSEIRVCVCPLGELPLHITTRMTPTPTKNLDTIYKSGLDKLDGYCRHFKNSMVHPTHDIGEQHLRKWLLYSLSKGALYSLNCTLISRGRDKFSSKAGPGKGRCKTKNF